MYGFPKWSCVAGIAVMSTGVLAAPAHTRNQRPPTAQQPPSTQQQRTDQQSKQATTTATKVDLDDLEKHPEKYEGKTVTVEGEVDRVLGPHLFTIDEKNWIDLDRELPVVVPDPFAAIVRSDSPVRVTGTVEKVPIATIERERSLLRREPKLKAEIETQPALVASEVTTVAPSVVTLRVQTDQPVGTSGSSGRQPVSDVDQLARAKDKNLVGRRVDLKNAPISGSSEEGFWIRLANGEQIFVMPSKKTSVREGQTAEIEGVVLQLPEGLRVQLKAGDEPIYIYANRVTPR
jgi:hypothetical protein